MESPYRTAGAVEAPSEADVLAKLEAELAATKKAREEAAAARAAARAKDPKRIADEIARTERAIEDDAKFADLVDEHGAENVRRVNTPRDGMVVVRTPDPLVFRRFNDAFLRSDHPNPKVRTSFHDEAEKMVRLSLVYPTRERFDEMASRCPTLVSTCANVVLELGKPQVEEDEGK